MHKTKKLGLVPFLQYDKLIAFLCVIIAEKLYKGSATNSKQLIDV